MDTGHGIVDVVEPEFFRDQFAYRIRLIQIAAFKQFEARLQAYGPAARYFGLLCFIETNPLASQGKLGDAIHLDRSSLVPILETLEKVGLVRRVSDPSDKRLRLVELTDQGRAIVNELKVHAARHEETLVAGFSDKERRTLLDMLKRVDENLRRERAASAHQG